MSLWKTALFWAGMMYSLLSFSAEQEAKLIVTNSAQWPPFSFVNDEGQPDGILVDLWEEFGKQTGTEIEFVLTDWQSSLDLIRNRKAHVHAGLYESAERNEYMDFSSTINVPLATRLFVSQRFKVHSIEELAIPVAVTKGGFAEAFIREHYPSVELLLFSNGVEAIQAAVDDKVFAFVSDYPAAMYYLHKLGTPEQFYVAETLYRENLKAAVPKGSVALLSQVNDGLDAIPAEEFNRVIQKWMYSESRLPRWLIPALVVAGLCITLLFALFYIVTLKKQVENRTRELELLSITDGLTGIYNRKKIENVLSSELARSRRYDKPLCVVLIDIDNFKQVNDRYGHAAGDDVLKDVVLLLKSHIRKVDSIGRWGGEEFLIVCPESPLSAGLTIAEKLRLLIDKGSFCVEEGCSGSFGVAEVEPGDSVSRIVKRADKALYDAKRNGRNRVCSYQGELIREEQPALAEG